MTVQSSTAVAAEPVSEKGFVPALLLWAAVVPFSRRFNEHRALADLPTADPNGPNVLILIWDRTTRGTCIYLATPRLRGLLAISLAVSAAGAMVIVNTVVLVKARFGLGEVEVAWALAAFGGGSMLAAFVLPSLLEKVTDRAAMLTGATVLVVGTGIGALLPSYALLLPLWLVIGFGYSLAQTPSDRLLRRSAHAEDRPAIFAAHFALSHACWLICYPLAGRFGIDITKPDFWRDSLRVIEKQVNEYEQLK